MRIVAVNQFEYRKDAGEIIGLFQKVSKIKKIWGVMLDCTPVLWLALFAVLTVIVNSTGR